MNVIKDKIIAAWKFIVSKLNVLFEIFELLLYKVFGKNRVINAKNWIKTTKQAINRRLYSHIDKDGAYSKTITTFYKWFYGLVAMALLFVFLLKTNFLYLTGGMPSIEQLQNPKMSQGSSIISADGIEIGQIYSENRSPVDSASISPWVFKCLIATEDKRFFQHSGIDLKRMGSVFLGVLSGDSDRGGGSTISQQLAKNLYNTRKKEMRGGYFIISLY